MHDTAGEASGGETRIGEPQAAGPSRRAGDVTTPFAVVTGASEGIGLAFARRLANRGQSLLLIARTPGPLEIAAAAIRAEHAVTVATLALDITAPDAPERLDAELARLGAHVDLLVNNAGVGYSGDFDTATEEELGRLVALNVAAPGRLMRHVLPGMRRRKRGGILNVSSLGGYTPGPYQAAYYASKAYVMSLSEAVAAEVRRDGVRVTAVAPGPVETRFHARMRAEGAFYRTLLPASSPESVARWALLGHDFGLKVVVPGIFNALGAVALRLLPHAILVPVMALLLDPRRSHEEGSR